MGEMLNMMARMWVAVGPGLLLAAALPVLMVAFALVARTGLKRARAQK